MLEKVLEKTTTRDLIPIIIMSIAIVGFWRGIWGLMDSFLFPQNHLISSLSSALIGLAILLGISFYKNKKN
jgi:hypothetical protein